MGKIKIEGYVCERCSHQWVARNKTNKEELRMPRVCPRCKSPYWDVPRKQKIKRIQNKEQRKKRKNKK